MSGGYTSALLVEDEAAMRALGERLAGWLAERRPAAPPARHVPAVVTLSGELGAGKSVLARAVLRALGHEGAVPSPTYAIVESYELPERRVAHLDLYRLADPDELHAIGFDEVLLEHDVVLIEWPERGGVAVPEPQLAVRIEHAPEGGRRVRVSRRGDALAGEGPGGGAGSERLDNADASSML